MYICVCVYICGLCVLSLYNRNFFPVLFCISQSIPSHQPSGCSVCLHSSDYSMNNLWQQNKIYSSGHLWIFFMVIILVLMNCNYVVTNLYMKLVMLVTNYNKLSICVFHRTHETLSLVLFRYWVVFSKTLLEQSFWL